MCSSAKVYVTMHLVLFKITYVAWNFFNMMFQQGKEDNAVCLLILKSQQSGASQKYVIFFFRKYIVKLWKCNYKEKDCRSCFNLKMVFKLTLKCSLHVHLNTCIQIILVSCSEHKTEDKQQAINYWYTDTVALFECCIRSLAITLQIPNWI